MECSVLNFLLSAFSYPLSVTFIFLTHLSISVLLSLTETFFYFYTLNNGLENTKYYTRIKYRMQNPNADSLEPKCRERESKMYKVQCTFYMTALQSYCIILSTFSARHQIPNISDACKIHTMCSSNNYYEILGNSLIFT